MAFHESGGQPRATTTHDRRDEEHALRSVPARVLREARGHTVSWRGSTSSRRQHRCGIGSGALVRKVGATSFLHHHGPLRRLDTIKIVVAFQPVELASRPLDCRQQGGAFDVSWAYHGPIGVHGGD